MFERKSLKVEGGVSKDFHHRELRAEDELSGKKVIDDMSDDKVKKMISDKISPISVDAFAYNVIFTAQSFIAV